MLALLKILDARMSEPSTYAGLSAVLMALNVNIDPGVWHQVTLYGTVAAGVLAMLLSEIGSKPPMQVAIDVLQTLASGMRTLAPDVAVVPPVAVEPGAGTAVKALVLLAVASIGLSACATVPATVTTTLTTAQQHAQQAIDLYQISKGIAQVAELADPALIPFVSGAIAVADPIVAKAQTALTDASTDAAALEALVAQITTQADSLTVGSASVIKVVPSSPAG